MHTQIELWQALVGVVVLALPITFVIYWIKDSILRIPAVWHEFWGKFSTKRTVSA
jgi:hypothetical protein